MRKSLRPAPGLLALLALLVVMIVSAPAWGHAFLLEQSPDEGASLEEAPEAVTLRFNEPVEPVFLRILDAEGAEAPGAGEARAEGREVALPLEAPLEDGFYLVTWRVVAADGHSVGGSYRFAVGVAFNERAGPVASPDGTAWAAVKVFIRVAHYGALLMAAGFPLLLLAANLPEAAFVRGRRAASRAAVLGLVLAPVYLAVTGIHTAGGDAAVLLDPRQWAVVLPASLVLAMAVAVLGLLGVLLAVGRQRPHRRWLLLPGPLLVAASFTVSGHVIAVEPAWLAMAAAGVHTLAAAYWIGSLYPLLCAVRHCRPEEAALALDEFAKAALPAVAALLIAGLVLAVLLLGEPADLVDTRYGAILAFKVLLVAGLLAVAAVNRYRLVPKMRRESSKPAVRGLLRRTLALDLGLAAAIIAATAALGTTAAPHALIEHADHAHHMHEGAAERSEISMYLQAGGHAALLVLRPGRPGANEAELRLLGEDGRVQETMEAEIHLASPQRDIAPLRRKVEPHESDVFYFEDLDLPFAGHWELRADVLIDDFTKAVFRADLEVE